MKKTVNWDTKEWGCSLGTDESCMELKVCFPRQPYGTWEDAERELRQEMKDRKIIFGLQEASIRAFFDAPGENVVFTAARGDLPRDDEDDRIEYFFVTDGVAHPARRPDGSVDFYELNVIQGCGRGDLLARLVQGQPGYNGRDIYGREVNRRPGKKLTLHPGKGTVLTEDGLEIRSGEDGHVVVREGCVCVSPVCRMNNVDLSTGNISFGGSVEIQGNVASNFSIRAGGDVVIWGSVEAACIEAEGNIVIRGGMNGMGKGSLRAGGNVLAKFLESANVEADGSVYCGAILYSSVTAGDFVEVDGKKGAIAGGRVTADSGITARYLGTVMGIPTIVAAGCSMKDRREYRELLDKQQKLAKEEEELKQILNSFAMKLSSGQKFAQGQLDFMKKMVERQEDYRRQKAVYNQKIEEMQKLLELERVAYVEVRDTAYPGVVIIIGDASSRIMTERSFGRFKRESGDVVMTSL